MQLWCEIGRILSARKKKQCKKIWGKYKYSILKSPQRNILTFLYKMRYTFSNWPDFKNGNFK